MSARFFSGEGRLDRLGYLISLLASGTFMIAPMLWLGLQAIFARLSASLPPDLVNRAVALIPPRLAAQAAHAVPEGLYRHLDVSMGLTTVTVGLAALCWLLGLWLYCAATAKRLHDIGQSGWLTLAALIPGLGVGAFCLALLFVRGDQGINRYGCRWL